MKETKDRKLEHINVCSTFDVEAQQKKTGFENVEFVHNALPEIDLDEIDLSTNFLGKKLDYPVVVTGMTGGHELSEKINKNLAEAAQKLGIALGLGSQRAMLEDKDIAYTYKVREVAPTILLMGNIGIPQLKKFSKEEIENAMKEIGADVLALHLNNLQEVIQKEGETKTNDSLKVISDFVENFEFPVIIKETGAGISKEVASKLLKTKIAGLDTGGAGGTSFAGVEILRTKNQDLLEFWDWGIPTAASILEVRSVSKEIPLMATGGIRSGLEAAKALALGADVVGIGLPLLKPARISSEKVASKLNKVILGLKTTMFLTGARNLQELKGSEVVIKGELLEWLRNRSLS